MVHLPDGLLSSVGLQNPGLEAVLRRWGPRWAASGVPIIVSICADTADDIAATLSDPLDLDTVRHRLRDLGL